MVHSRSLPRSTCSPAFLSLMSAPMAMPVSSRLTTSMRSCSTTHDESTMTRLTPAAPAAATIAWLESSMTDPLPPSVLMTASAPSRARERSDLSVAEPLTTRTLELPVVSFSGERTSAVTVWPAASACSTTRRPVRPVAPRTTSFMTFLLALCLKLKLQVANLNKLKRQLIPRNKPVRWLNNREWSAWLHLLATFTLLPAALDSQLQREAGMSHFEFGVMAALSRQPGRRLQLKDLAVVANGSLSRLSHVISRLERQGWVRRVSGARGRATNAELTDKGLKKLMETGPIHFAEVRRLVFDVLTPEDVKELRRVTNRLNAGLIPETNLGPLARRTRASALRRSS